MLARRQSTGQSLRLDAASTVGAGGEARIYNIPRDTTLVAKVYHHPTPAHGRKLAAMIANAPDDPMAANGHISIAWPLDLLLTTDRQPQVIGFVMRRADDIRSIMTYYNPRTRRQQSPLFNYRYLHRTGHNLAAAVRALHDRGYVIGDVNAANMLVTDTALVTLVDTDSFQVREPQNGAIYRCPVGRPEYTPPELQGRAFADIDRVPEHDRFGLAVLIFQLLMEGVHPFAGVFQGQGDPPPYEARIASGHFPYSQHCAGPYHPMPFAPSFALLHPALQDLFLTCFEKGHANPGLRPDAHAWQKALREAERTLISCRANEQHLYSEHCSSCPWCERAKRLGGRDPFPSRQAVQGQHHTQAAPPAQMPLRSPAPPTRPMPAATSPHPTPPVPRATSRPSWMRSVLSGALWGAISGALVWLLVRVLLAPTLALQANLDMLWTLGWGARWSVAWGVFWGMFWGACRRPAIPVSQGGPSPWGRILSGGILGVGIGVGVSMMMGLTPIGLSTAPEDALVEALLRVDWRGALPTIQQALHTGFQKYAISGASIGAFLGIVWGACGR